jgi:DNA-binding NarL/FixJ family response regulator
MTRVLIIDDHPIFRQGLRHLIESVPGLCVVGEASDLTGAAQQLAGLQPDVAIIDLNLGTDSGLDLVHRCHEMKPRVAAVVLTMHREESLFEGALRAGAAAYVLKENASEDVLLAIRSVAAGGFFLSASLKEFLGRKDKRDTAPAGPTDLTSLTPTERRVLRLIGTNLTSKEIAHELCISPRTVDSHRAHICERLNLRGAQSLLRFALEHRALL